MKPQSLSDLYSQNPVKACQLALRRTRKEPSKTRLEKINALLGTHGTEAIRGEWQNGYWCDVVAAYCNTGDCYDVTVIHVRGWSSFNPGGTFRVSSVGDFVERNEKRLHLI